MFAPAGQTTARACLRSKLAGFRCAPPSAPEPPMPETAVRRGRACPAPTDCCFRHRVLRGCERGATVERSETGERAMFAPAGQTTARACLRSKLAALVVRRQAPPNPRCRKQQSVGAGHAGPAYGLLCIFPASCWVASAGPQLSAAKLGSEQCLPLRGKQPHERVCEANWRRSLCAAKRPRTPDAGNSSP